MEFDGNQREFIIHVPAGYQGDRPIPVVFMLHGSNHHPGTIYNSSHWKEKSEQETILVVYPGSWRYRLIGETGLHEKWNSRDMQMLVEPGTELQDDVRFVGEVMACVRLGQRGRRPHLRQRIFQRRGFRPDPHGS